MGKFTQTTRMKTALRVGTAALALGAVAIVATPWSVAQAQTAPAPADEALRYSVRILSQQFDGAREASRTQVAGIARARRGSESWTEINFGHGSIVSTRPRNVAAGSFTNGSGVEAGLRYDHATGTLAGAPAAVAAFHNSHIRPLLAGGPAPGADAAWTVSVMPAQLGFPGLGARPITIELSRRYFRHGGRDYVLVHYRIPSVAYAGSAGPVVHWGEGIALTDPGFGTIYWNAALHRAVAQEAGGSGRPYRYARTVAAVDARGNPLIDPRRIPEAAPHFGRFYGHSNEEVMGYTDADGVSDQQPLAVAGQLDTLALALGEGGGGAAARLTAVDLSGARGNEAARPAPRPLAEAAARQAAAATRPASAAQTAGDTATSSASGGGDAMKRRNAQKGGQGTPPPQPATMASEIESMNRLRSLFSGGVTWTSIVAGTPEETRVFQTIGDAMQAWRNEGQRLRREYESVRAAYQRSLEEIGRHPSSSLQPAPGTETARLHTEMQVASGRVERMQQQFEAALRDGRSGAAEFRDYQAARAEYDSALRAFETHTPGPNDFVPVPGSRASESIRFAQQEAQRIARLEQEMAEHGRMGARISSLIQEIPQYRFPGFIASVNALNEALGPLGMAMDTYSIGAALGNLANELGQDAASGDITTSRQYGAGNALFWVDLSADFLGLAGSALTGDVPGFFASAAAITTGSVTDIFLAARGLQATNQLVNELLNQEREMDERRSNQLHASVERLRMELRDLGEEVPAAAEEALAELERSQQMSQQMLAEIRARREERLRQEEVERQRLIAEARAENERIYQENLRRPPTAEEWAQFNRDIEAAMRPDYPTAPPPSPAQVAARLERAEEQRRQEAAAAAQAIAEAAAAAAAAAAAEQARQEELAQAQADAVEAREQEAQARADRNDAAEQRGLDVSSLDTQPVTFQPVDFEPPQWDPPQWDPPEWVPPQFDPPEASEIPWTDFDDDNWLQQGGNLAYDYGNMAGVVETDLSRWAEWLATQNVRELTRLALLAGYPNLASALADAENIIRLSQDDGYRRWAMQAPSCGGYVGCGPSYLERWWMKQAIVRLGDILAQSRDIFSSGGLTDIGISGLNLSYLLRDNALQDGDIIRVRITQFGRTLFEGETTLTNLGERFSQLLRPGVGSLEIFAVNEGFSPPNTAQIVLDNVTRGNATQSYSLRTGETATLRIETNARAQ